MEEALESFNEAINNLNNLQKQVQKSQETIDKLNLGEHCLVISNERRIRQMEIKGTNLYRWNGKGKYSFLEFHHVGRLLQEWIN